MYKGKEKKIIAIIPARGGSKGIPKKNIIDFCGRPLLGWSIRQAKHAKLVSDVYVSTDDKQISEVAAQYGAKVIVRPKNISGDFASSEDALKHAVEYITKNEDVEIKYVVFLQATSPLRESSDIDAAIQTIEEKKADSLFTGAGMGDIYTWEERNGKLSSFNYDYKNRKRRQDFEEQYMENGSIYIFKPEVLFKYNNRFGNKIALSKMAFWKTFEVDDYESLDLCKILFKSNNLHKK